MGAMSIGHCTYLLDWPGLLGYNHPQSILTSCVTLGKLSHQCMPLHEQ